MAVHICLGDRPLTVGYEGRPVYDDDGLVVRAQGKPDGHAQHDRAESDQDYVAQTVCEHASSPPLPLPPGSLSANGVALSRLRYHLRQRVQAWAHLRVRLHGHRVVCGGRVSRRIAPVLVEMRRRKPPRPVTNHLERFLPDGLIPGQAGVADLNWHRTITERSR